MRYLPGRGGANIKPCWLAGCLAGLMAARLARSHPSQLPSICHWKAAALPQVGTLCRPGRVISVGPGSAAGRLAPLPSLPGANPRQRARSHTDLMYSLQLECARRHERPAVKIERPTVCIRAWQCRIFTSSTHWIALLRGKSAK